MPDLALDRFGVLLHAPFPPESFKFWLGAGICPRYMDVSRTKEAYASLLLGLSSNQRVWLQMAPKKWVASFWVPRNQHNGRRKKMKKKKKNTWTHDHSSAFLYLFLIGGLKLRLDFHIYPEEPRLQIQFKSVA